MLPADAFELFSVPSHDELNAEAGAKFERGSHKAFYMKTVGLRGPQGQPWVDAVEIRRAPSGDPGI